MKVKIKPQEGFITPIYATKGAACFDLFAAEPFTVLPNQTVAVSLGFCIELPESHYLELRPRSGLAYNKNVTLMNSPGTVDSDYRDVVKALIYNASLSNFSIKQGDRICQGMIKERGEQTEFEINDELSETERKGGFGSTGTDNLKN